jgi:hypothetical protein
MLRPCSGLEGQLLSTVQFRIIYPISHPQRENRKLLPSLDGALTWIAEHRRAQHVAYTETRRL